MAISVSPQTSLFLGLYERVKNIALPFCSIRKLSTTFLFNLFTNQGVHNVDFSGVRDDKCHTGVGQSRVTNLTS